MFGFVLFFHKHHNSHVDKWGARAVTISSGIPQTDFFLTLFYLYFTASLLPSKVEVYCKPKTALKTLFFSESRRWPAEQTVLTDVIHILNVTEIQLNVHRGTISTQVWGPAQFCPWYIIHGDSQIPNHHFEILFLLCFLSSGS